MENQAKSREVRSYILHPQKKGWLLSTRKFSGCRSSNPLEHINKVPWAPASEKFNLQTAIWRLNSKGRKKQQKSCILLLAEAQNLIWSPKFFSTKLFSDPFWAMLRRYGETVLKLIWNDCKFLKTSFWSFVWTSTWGPPPTPSTKTPALNCWKSTWIKFQLTSEENVPSTTTRK